MALICRGEVLKGPFGTHRPSPKRAFGSLPIDEPFEGVTDEEMQQHAQPDASAHVDQVACGWGHTVVSSKSLGLVAVCGRPTDFQGTVRSVKMAGRGSSLLLWASRRIGQAVFGDDLGALRPAFVEALSASPQQQGHAIQEVLAGSGALTGVRTCGGGLLLCGSDLHGECGLGTDASEHCVPCLAKTFPDVYGPSGADAPGSDDRWGIVMADAGFHHAVALDESGCVLCWGKNGRGEVGDGTVETRRVPQVVLGPHDTGEDGEDPVRAVAVSAGFRHSAALLADGRVMVWGRLQASQAGAAGRRPSAEDDAREPREAALPAGTEAAAVACGQAHTAIVTTAGDVLLMGQRGAGLELDATLDREAGEEEGAAGRMAAAGQAAAAMAADGAKEDDVTGLGAGRASGGDDMSDWTGLVDWVAQPVRVTTLKACERTALLARDGVEGTAEPRLRQVVAGVSHTYFVFESGVVARVGWRGSPEAVEPLCVPGIRVKQVSLGLRHGAAVVELEDKHHHGMDDTSKRSHSAVEAGAIEQVLREHAATKAAAWDRFALT
jgi:hypothetical protein